MTNGALERKYLYGQMFFPPPAEIAADENSFRTKHLSVNDSQSQLVISDMVSNPGRVVSRREGNSYRVNMPERCAGGPKKIEIKFYPFQPCFLT